MPTAMYEDRRISCSDDGLALRGYYFPWGTKHIPYDEIVSLRRIKLSPLRGKARIWGSGNPRYWASLDLLRPTKDIGVVLDLGHFVRPFITPDDPDAFEAAVREHTTLAAADPVDPRGPII